MPVTPSRPLPRSSLRSLLAAIRRADVAQVIALAATLAPIRTTWGSGMVATCSTSGGDGAAEAMVDALLRAGVNPNARETTDPSSALSLAIRESLWGTAARLLAAGGVVIGPVTGGRAHSIDALTQVALAGPLPLLRTFLDSATCGGSGITRAGFDACETWVTRHREFPAIAADRAQVLDAFLDAGLPVNALNAVAVHQRSLLRYAVVLKDADLVARLIARGASLDGRSFEEIPPDAVPSRQPGMTHAWVPLAHLAVLHDDRAVVERLLAHGVRFDEGAGVRHDSLGAPAELALRLGARQTLIALEQHELLVTMAAESSDGLTPARALGRPRSRL